MNPFTKFLTPALLLFAAVLQGVSGMQSIRKPAVAGQFYPADPALLRKEVTSYIKAGSPLAAPPVILISPHAGYVFSGPVAGKGYATIDKNIKTVILIGPSHHKWFHGISISSAQSYETPLGEVPLNTEIIARLRQNPLTTDDAQADKPEHSLEVQLPFLQVALSSFSIVPILTGRVDPADIAKAILPFVKDGVMIIASSDLSHYHTDTEARTIDQETIAAILAEQETGVLDACGETAIRVALHLAQKLDLKPVLLDARNSYQTAPASGSKDRVVGYASIAFVKDNGAADQETLPATVRSYLLALARASLEASVRQQPLPSVAAAPAMAQEKRGCFVTLTKQGQLRGCIGYIEPIKPLVEAVIDNAQSAALRDPRFDAVIPDELKDIVVEVSVLTKPALLEYKDPADLLSKLLPGEDGIILRKGYQQSTFLPQVWEQLPGKVEFLEHLSLKGGMSKDGWKTAEVKRYRAVHFREGQ